MMELSQPPKQCYFLSMLIETLGRKQQCHPSATSILHHCHTSDYGMVKEITLVLLLSIDMKSSSSKAASYPSCMAFLKNQIPMTTHVLPPGSYRADMKHSEMSPFLTQKLNSQSYGQQEDFCF